MSKQKRQAMQSLDEKCSPFVPTRAQKIFRNTANLSLRGSTFDAKHLDRFLTSSFGEKSLNQPNSSMGWSSLDKSLAINRTVHSQLPPYMINTSEIKPHTAFLNLGRD